MQRVTGGDLELAEELIEHQLKEVVTQVVVQDIMALPQTQQNQVLKEK